LSGFWSILSATIGDWYEDRAQRLGAALAYYTVFALAPTIVLVIAVAAVVLGHEAARDEILLQIHALVGEQGAKAVESLIATARDPGASSKAIGLGLVTLIFGLWGVFGELQDALNTIWGVTPKADRGVLDTIRQRFWSFALVVGTGFLLLVSLAISTWISILTKYFWYLLPLPGPMLEAANFVVSFGVVTVLFALTFKLLPDVEIAWRDVWLGAAVTALLFTVGKLVIGLYLGKSGVASAFGAAGSLVVILVWVYYSAQILYFGAEFTKVWTRRRGSGAAPSEIAEPVTAEARAEQGLGPTPASR
jgi:membrane protein